MNPSLREPDPVPPPPTYGNLLRLAHLMSVFHELSDVPAPDLLGMETEIHWKTWSEAAAVELRSESLGGVFVLNLLEKTLRVRFLADGVGCVARILIRLDSPLGLVAQAIELTDHYAASGVGSALLRRVQDCAPLISLEYSIVKGLARRLSVDDLARELER